MIAKGLSESQKEIASAISAKEILEKFERSRILEVYFSRLDGRIPEHISDEYQELYQVELVEIKNFLLGQHPQDSLLQKIFRMMS